MIAELYPSAWAHLGAAKRLTSDLSSLWGEVLDAETFDTSAVTDPDGHGHIAVYASWPSGARDRMTEVFRSCIDELWACLDSLVAESVAMFSILERTRDLDAPRYFPIADTEANFERLLAQSCLDGILATQFQMIRDCQ